MFKSKYNNIIIYVSAFVILGLILFAFLRNNADDITLNQTKQLLQEHQVTKVVATKEYVYLDTKKGYYRIASSQITPNLFADYTVYIQNDRDPLLYIFGLIVLLGAGSLVFRYFQKNRALQEVKTPKGFRVADDTQSDTPIQAIKPDVSFDDIGGLSEVKLELEEIIDFMKNPTKYHRFGAKLPRGVLLVGPPGVGKTMIAKALANEAGVAFFYQSGAAFVQIYVGMGAKRVHELFAAAKKNSPAIIFIDEIDAVGKKRDGTRNDERESTLNQLLTEMDGFEDSSDIIVVGATNKIEVLDSALLRSGRFDRRVFVDIPTKSERVSILSKYLTKIPNNVDVDKIANLTVGFSGAALATLINEAALLSIRQNYSQLITEHFFEVKDKVLFGKKKLLMLSEEQKAHRICYQAGKAVIATIFDVEFEKLLLSNDQITPPNNYPALQHELEIRIKMLLGGMAACELKFHEHANTIEIDLNEAKELVSDMVQKFGMGEELFASKAEEVALLKKLYKETKQALSDASEVVRYAESVLLERESVSKREISEKLHALL